MTAPKARQLTPLTCELGEHVATGSIYRARPGDKWGCAEHVAAEAKARGCEAPGWLRV